MTDHRKETTVTTKLSMLIATLIATAALALGASLARADSNQIPFRASFTATITTLSATDVYISGTGIATVMGQSTYSGHATATGTGSCAGGFANDNYQTLTAANGDTLSLFSHDVACPVGGEYYHGTGHWVVTSGTGRFSGATGQGTFDGLGHLVPGGAVQVQLTGTISAPNGG
jgi:hypothetical protein